MKPDRAVSALPGCWVPTIDLKHCKGCGNCVEACPNKVLEIRSINPADYERLGWFARMKIRHHGMRVARVVRAADCESCGQCLAVCREHAIFESPLISDPTPATPDK